MADRDELTLKVSEIMWGQLVRVSTVRLMLF